MYKSTPSSNVLIDQLIGAYNISGNRLFLDRIIEVYTPKIETTISRTLVRHGIYNIPFIQKTDYIDIGTVALVKALSRVDTKNPKFEYYLMRRVQGAIIDELRARGPYKRSMANNGWSKPRMVSLDEAVAKSSPGSSPEEAAMMSERAQMIERAISDLPEREKGVVLAYFYSDMTDKSIAASGMLGTITESGVNRIRHRAQRMLAEKLSSLN